MATLLYPVDQFSKNKALEWISEIKDQDLRDQLCKNILQRLPYADELVVTTINSKEDNIVTTGLWVF